MGKVYETECCGYYSVKSYAGRNAASLFSKY